MKMCNCACEYVRPCVKNGALLRAQVLDLSSVSPELAWVAEDADLVIFEGMVRARV
jgi:hypothetical protein